jgi:Fe2+ transport system protein FeoA
MTGLHTLPIGVVARIRTVAQVPLVERMAAMGLRPGAEVTVIARGSGGSCLVRVGDARLSVARELARGIQVESTRVQ